MDKRIIKECIDLIDDALGEKSTFVDKNTGLEWQLLGSCEKMTWYDASEYAVSIGDGWRLPTVRELLTIVDYEKSNIDQKKVQALKNQNELEDLEALWSYWSSTEVAHNKNHAWCVEIHIGGVHRPNKYEMAYVKLVRS